MFCKIVLPSKEIHKLLTVPKTFAELEDICKKKFSDKLPPLYNFQYTDSDNELISLMNDEDLQTAILGIEQEKLKTLRIQIFKAEPLIVSSNSDQQNKIALNGNENQVNKKNGVLESLLESLPLSSSLTDLDEDLNLSKNNNNAGQDLLSSVPGQLDRSRKSISHPSKNLSNKGSQEYDTIDFFTPEQLKSITEMIDFRIKECMEVEIMKLVEEAWSRMSNGAFIRQPKKFMTYTVGNNAMKKSIQKIKQEPDEEREQAYHCNGCIKKITGVRWCCTVCRDFDFCEECEKKNDHPHSFIKYKPPPKKIIISPDADHEKINSPPKVPLIRTISRSKTLPQEDERLDCEKFSNESVTPQPSKTFQAKVLEYPVYDVHRVKPEALFTITFTIKNSGEDQWPDDVRYICIEGMNQGSEERISALTPNKSCVVVLPMQAPKEVDKYISTWKLHYTENDGNVKRFGPTMYFEIHVVAETEQKLESKRARAFSGDDIFGKAIEPLPDDQTLLKKYKCSVRVLENAKLLHDMIPTDGIGEKIEFVRECPITMSLDDIVGKYFDYSSKKKKDSAKAQQCVLEDSRSEDEDDD